MQIEGMQNIMQRCADITCVSPWKEGSEKETLVQVYFWLDGVVRCVIASIGFLGNIFTMIVFSSKELRSTFHVLLVVLAFFDLGYLILTLLEEILHIYDITTKGCTYPDPNCNPNQIWVILFPEFIHPLQYVFLTASEFFTVALSVDRYIAIKYPLQYYSRWNTSTFDTNFLGHRRAKGANDKRMGGTKHIDWYRVTLYSVSVFLFSLCYCIPVFFEYEKGNNTATIKESKMYGQESYAMGYYVVLDCIFRFCVPVCILMYTNYGIYTIVKKQPTTLNDAAYQRRVQNVMLFGVVVLLMIVHLYRFGLNIGQTTIHHKLECCGKDAMNLIVHVVGSVLLTCNSSANCFIYLATSKRFRDLAFRRYTWLPSWFSSYYGRVCVGRSINGVTPNHRKRTVICRKRKLTPFGSGYISWGATELGNIHVIVSQKTTEIDRVMEVSVIGHL